MNEVEIAVHDGEDVLSAARDLIAERADVTPRRFLEAPILLSRAIAYAVDQAPSRDMANKLRATGEVALQFWGAIPLSALDTENVANLFCFISRLPRDDGRKHGNNRYDRSRGLLSKHEEVAAADGADEEIRNRILAQSGLTLVERWARLGEQRTLRVTEATLEHHLNRLHAILRRAEEHLGWTRKTRFPNCALGKGHMVQISGEIILLSGSVLRADQQCPDQKAHLRNVRANLSGARSTPV